MNIGTCASTPATIATQPSQNESGWWNERPFDFIEFILISNMLGL